jgi:hypothetical protein
MKKVKRYIRYCLYCGKKIFKTKARLKSGQGKYCCRKCKDEDRHNQIGTKSCRWNSKLKTCIICKKKFWVKKSWFFKTKCCSNKCRYEYYKIICKGKGNPAYIDGRSKIPYPEEFNIDLKDEIIQLFNNKCCFCGKRKYKRKLDIHHIDHIKNNCNKNNLIPLCRRCHIALHNERFGPTRYLDEIETKEKS